MNNLNPYPFSQWTTQAWELQELFQSWVRENIVKAINALHNSWVINDAISENNRTNLNKNTELLNNKWWIPYNIKPGECWSDSDWNSYFINDRWEQVPCR